MLPAEKMDILFVRRGIKASQTVCLDFMSWEKEAYCYASLHERGMVAETRRGERNVRRSHVCKAGDSQPAGPREGGGEVG